MSSGKLKAITMGIAGMAGGVSLSASLGPIAMIAGGLMGGLVTALAKYETEKKEDSAKTVKTQKRTAL